MVTVVSFCIFAVVAIVVALFVGSFAGSLHSKVHYDAQMLATVVYDLSGAVVTLILLLLCSLVFLDLSRGHAPFTGRQARRFKIGAIALLLYAFVGALTTPDILRLFGATDQWVVYETPFAWQPLVVFRAWPLVASMFLWALAYVFGHGEVLQDLADHTV